jgi:hypothetical protein
LRAGAPFLELEIAHDVHVIGARNLTLAPTRTARVLCLSADSLRIIL